ncbi:adenylate/guanylate cyclase domain-containing protein [Ferrovibrio sp.]|uniref:CHASE2 domain-containing protein n=1 Tax=Ferrovibrio sp. TaxID=1917215 RepID=UPI0025C68AFE|nr:adenylate/guanylate cyclase domain-containing protein [Ferrovibrio sp.]MBX3454892.1 adenylate/guanylate cyclase domain-containing protein [Ferrovibrio sp.]
MRFSKHLVSIIPAMLLVLALFWRAFDPAGLIVDFRTTVFDYYQRLAPREYQPVPVRILDIDDESIEKLGLQWPWPRTLVAEIIARLANAGAAATVFDVVFSEPDRTSPSEVSKIWQRFSQVEDRADDLAEKLAGLPDHDAMLAQIIGQAENVVTGFVLVSENNGAKPRARAGFAAAGDNPRQFLSGDFMGAVPTLKILEDASAGNGSFNFHPGRDLVIRSVPLLFKMGDQLYPSIAAEGLRVAQRARSYVVKSSGASGETALGAASGINTIRIGNFEVPTNATGELPVHFTLPVPERYVPVWKLLADEVDPQLLDGHIVLIGTSASGLRDIRPSPINPVMPGVEAHAQATEQILLGHFLQRPDWAAGAEWLFTVALGLGLILLLARSGAMWSAVIGASAIVLAIGLSWYGYRQHLLLVDPVTPSLIGFAVYLSGSLTGYLRTEAEKKQVRGAFAQYLSPALVEQLAADPTRLRLGGETRDMTFLFCDIRGFTAVSEQFKGNPQGLTKLINRFLTPMTDVILARQGTIDKYMGDCIMAFWNAPLDDPRHAEHACESALTMFARLKLLNAELKAEAEAEQRPFIGINIGIGLNTGECVVGNMGSEQRFDYSVLGDAVNLASRLEGQSKTYGVGVVIGELTRRAAPGWAALELDLIAVKGKKEAVRIFALLGDATEAESQPFKDFTVRHDAMLAAYRAQDWDGVAAALPDLRGIRPDLDGLYDLYQERVEFFRAEPPGESWDGVFVATSK